MLVLTRRVGETLFVGDDVTFKVLSIKGNQIKCGIDAPKTVSIHREEVYKRIKKEKQFQKESAYAATEERYVAIDAAYEEKDGNH